MERTYTVTWQRPDGEVYTCQGLTPRIAFARLWAAWKNSGEITVIDVTPEWLTDESVKNEEWPYAVPPPKCDDDRDGTGWTCVVYDGTGLWCDACTQWSEENAAVL